MIFQEFKKEKLNIICLQETYLTGKNIECLDREWTGDVFSSPGTCHSKGLVILLCKNHQYKNVKIVHQSERILAISFIENNEKIILLNVYAPYNVTEKIVFFGSVSDILEKNHQK